MNDIFRDYYENKQKGNPDISNLKEISQKLELGYSTILHKFKEFKEKKEVKGGYLLEIGDSRRKYKKSVDVQNLIRQALEKVEPTNAV